MIFDHCAEYYPLDNPIASIDCMADSACARLQVFEDRLQVVFLREQPVMVGILLFRWEVKVQVVWKAQAGQALKVPITILFSKTGQDKEYSVQGSPQDLRKVLAHLTKKLNFKNFHQTFKIFKKIGEGSQASVYEGLRVQNGERVAVRAVKKRKSTKAVQQQIKLLRSLDHDSVIKVKQVFQSANTIYLVQELLQGGSLFGMIRCGLRLLRREVQSILLRLVKVLLYLQSQGVVHRDIKPENILIRDRASLEIMLIDFGLAIKLNDQNKQNFCTRGTIGYIAPQLYQRGPIQSRCSDVFSVGVVLFTLLTGHYPYNSPQVSQIEQLNRSCTLQLDSAHFLKLGEQERDLLRKMLEKDFSQRITPVGIMKHPFLSEMRSSLSCIQPIRIKVQRKIKTNRQSNIDKLL